MFAITKMFRIDLRMSVVALVIHANQFHAMVRILHATFDIYGNVSHSKLFLTISLVP
jgi:hypothetical protein